MSDLLDRVNQYGVLKAPLWLWLIAAFEARHWVLFIAVGASTRRSPDAARLMGGDVPYLQLALEVPVMVLVYAALNREPGAPQFVRWLWAKGREIITLAAALNLAWNAWYLSQVTHWKAMPDNVVVLTAVIDVLIVVSVWTNGYLRELFADFPKPKPPEAKP